MKEIIVFKGTGTYADSLRAIGTAGLLEEISGTQVIIKDMGTHFQLKCAIDILPEKWNKPTPGFYYIWRKSKEKDKPSGVLVLDYEEEKSKAEQKKKSGNKNKKVNKVLEEQGLAAIEKINKEYRPAAILESMRKGWSSDKDIYKWVMQKPDEALKWTKSELLKQDPILSPIEVNNSQFYNPVSGKGVHAAKTEYRSPGAISDEVIEPFAEWMKYRGASIAMLPYRNGDDFKLFVIEPAEIGTKSLSLLREGLLELNLGGRIKLYIEAVLSNKVRRMRERKNRIKLDIEAVLYLTKELIIHSDVVQESTVKINLHGKKPQEVIKGLRQAFFKSMGTAAALMNDAFLPLPNWFRIGNRDDANVFLEIIKEHIGYFENGQKKAGCLGSLDETHSGDILILQQYRKWLTTGELSDLLEFFARFAVYIMEKREKKEWVKEFSTENLTELFKRGYDMKEIVENEGFLSIARGIRNCTIYAVSLNKHKWRIRFGLAQQWKQKIKGGTKEFIPVLCDFVQTQNWEVEHRLEGKGHTVKKEDLDSIIALAEQHGVELVGMLLLAYGYARAPKTENEKSNREGK